MSAALPDHRTTVWRLALMAVGMFGFVFFGLVPLYGLLCETTGLGGRGTMQAYQYDPAAVTPDRSRIVEVTFMTNNNAGMPWSFEPLASHVKVFPGELKEVLFRVHNPTDKPMVAQAIPSLIPINVVDQFHKTECFCFRQQILQPGETRDLPMRFVIDRELPRQVTSIQMAYTLFDVTPKDATPTAHAPKQTAGIDEMRGGQVITHPAATALSAGNT